MRNKTSETYVCDFETLADNTDYTYVWAWGASSLDDPEKTTYGTSIYSFIEWCKKRKTLYFHNLAFDASFILDYLFRNSYEYKEKEERTSNSFYIIKSDDNALYMIDITWKYKDKKTFSHTVIYDSFKKLPFSVENIAKGWGLSISKLEIDYKAHREENGELTQEEIDYLLNDVKIVCYALKSLIDGGNTRMTIGSDAVAHFKKTKSKKALNIIMPPLTIDEDTYMRKAYKGGFTYVNPRYANKEIGKGLVFDVNSLYPSRMYFCPMPYGKPVYYTGEYVKDDAYPLFIAHIQINFKIKKDHIPCIQIKNNFKFRSTEYLTSSDNELVDLYVSSVDYNLIMQQYEILDIIYIDGYKFASCTGVFNEYIDRFMEDKKKYTGAKRQEAKLFLNNLYGKLATNPNRKSKIAYFDHEENIVKYTKGKEEIKTSLYLPMGIFITAEARYMTITNAQKLYDRFIYADTDSLHLVGDEIPNTIEIHDKDLGKWALESKFTRGKFIRPKTYIEEVDGKLHVTCAGLPSKCHNQVTWNNFKSGTEYTGKLMPKVVKGGIVLIETTFKIK